MDERSVIALWIVSGVAIVISLVADRVRTRKAALKGLKMFIGIAPLLLGLLAAMSLLMAAVPPDALARALGGNGPPELCLALAAGSLAFIPGFVAYPLAAMLRESGASVAVIAAFITSLVMVGIFTLPMEARFFGWRVALLRNGLALVGAMVVATLMALVLA